MDVVARLDDIGRPAWIGLMVLSFIVWWPLGLAMLAFLIWSGRMGCRKYEGFGRWQRGAASERFTWPGRRAATSGNRAFDDYRAETLRRLEDEQKEFMEFLDRLRHAKDKAEFDQFMADRSRRPSPPENQPEA